MIFAHGLAAYRLTRILIKDDIAEPWRIWRNTHVTGKPMVLLSCGHCLSVWFAFALVAVFGPRNRFVVRSLAAAGVASLAWSIDKTLTERTEPHS